MAELYYQDAQSELWLGNCLDECDVESVMGGRKADLLCLDAPYSARTHAGHDHGAREARVVGRRSIDYTPWTQEDVRKFVDTWTRFSIGWRVSITDHTLAASWESVFRECDLCTFAPIPMVETGSRVRLGGDGPSSWTCWLVVGRPRKAPFVTWGTLPGAYVQPAEGHSPQRIVGGKPLESMCGIVRDYSRRGGLVVDPTCGAGTCLLAAKKLGRRSIGMDINEKHLEIAKRRLTVAREQLSLLETEPTR